MKIKTLLLMLVIVLVNATVSHPAAASVFHAPNQITPEPLDLPPGDAYLSPDGMHILVVSTTETAERSLCVYSAAGQQESCGKFPTTPDLRSLRWSPDSKWIALTEDFFRIYLDPDLWVMDAQTGKVTDLTDDQIKKVNIAQMGAMQSVDVSPAWAPDSKQVVFIRYNGVKIATDPDKYEEHADLYSISPAGGNPVQVGTLLFPANTRPFSTYILSISPDGKQVAYNVAYNVDTAIPGDTQNGLWVANLDGKNPRQILNVSGLTDIAFSADGRFVLGLNALVLLKFKGAWDQSSSVVIALDGDKQLPVDSDHLAQWAGWSPNGAAMTYIVAHSQQSEQDGLYVVDEPGKAGKQVYAGEVGPPAKSGVLQVERNLYWASNNTVLLRGPDQKLILLHLETNP